MKILKPDDLAVVYRCMRYARTHSLAIGMMACFSIDARPRAALHPENELWDAAAQALGKAVLDEGYPKPAAEFKAYGAACAPEGTRLAAQRVSIRVGAVSHSLVVSGERHFNALGIPTRPEPYACMPIEPATVFGGPDCADNPLGKGAAPIERDGRPYWPLPNVEEDTARIVRAGDVVVSAGFGGVDCTIPQRSQHLGRCDGRWLKRDWPNLPDDTSVEWFMTAPPGQRMTGFFRGDEAIEICNMHPQHAVLQSRLPGLRARCFVHTHADVGEPTPRLMPQSVRQPMLETVELREIEARAETVWLFPEQACGIVLYRAVAEVSDPDAADVSHLMMAWEPLVDAPLPIEYYRQAFAKQSQGLAEGTPASTAPLNPEAAAVPTGPVSVTPLPVPAFVAGLAPLAVSDKGVGAGGIDAKPTSDATLSNEAKQIEALESEIERQTALLMQRHGLTKKDLDDVLARSKAEPDVGGKDLDEMMREMDSHTQALMREHHLSEHDLQRFLAPVDPAGELPTGVSEKEHLAALFKQITDARTPSLKQSAMSEAVLLEKLAATNPRLVDLIGKWDAEALAQDADNGALATPLMPPWPATSVSAPAPASNAGAAAMPGAPAEAEPMPSLTREGVMARHAEHAGFVDLDLSGLDLSELDLSGADFSGALLDQTSFARSTLQGTAFDQALLRGTDFSDANLRGARMAKSSAGGARFPRADLCGAHLEKADFTGADFSAAQLREAVLCGAVFDRAVMPGVQASACHADGAQFADCDLNHADFAGARLSHAVFSGSQIKDGNFSNTGCAGTEWYGIQAQGARFTRSDLKASRADATSCFDGAQLDDAQLDRACWSGAQLRRASLLRTALNHADFSEVQAEGACFRLALAKQSTFAKANLQGADLCGINLFKGSLRRATLTKTWLSDANLYGVDFEGTTPTIASLEGSNIDHTILRFRPAVI